MRKAIEEYVEKLAKDAKMSEELADKLYEKNSLELSAYQKGMSQALGSAAICLRGMLAKYEEDEENGN